MARELRKRGIPTEQIKVFLGHPPSGSDATTSIYAPYEPDFLKDAAGAIEEVTTEVRGHLRQARIDRPDVDPSDVARKEAYRLTRAASAKKGAASSVSSFSPAMAMQPSCG